MRLFLFTPLSPLSFGFVSLCLLRPTPHIRQENHLFFFAFKLYARLVRPKDLCHEKELNMKITLLIRNQVRDGKENKCKYIYMLKLSKIDERLLYKIICGNHDYGKRLLLSFFKYMYHALFTTCM